MMRTAACMAQVADLHAAQWGTEFDLVGLVLHVGEVFHGAPSPDAYIHPPPPLTNDVL